jgi:hypothetical protein
MRTHDWKAILGNAANAAVIAASLAVVTAVVVDLRGTRRAAPEPEVKLSSLRNGVKAPRIPGVDYAGSERTLLLFLGVRCQYCQQSVPFYRAGSRAAKTSMSRRYRDSRFRISRLAELRPLSFFPARAGCCRCGAERPARKCRTRCAPRCSRSDGAGRYGRPTVVSVRQAAPNLPPRC